ncbi:MAG: hypothetical protein KDH88_12135 [Chromatiales bacterium]|nr:hypothetical protein [Chromatiales bacterium]
MKLPKPRLSLALLSALLAGTVGAQWLPLGKDQVHDPQSPVIDILQAPGEALSQLPPDDAGNHVRWVDALRGGYIQPRSTIFDNTQVRLLDQDIVMRNTGSAAYVRFPHRVHTEWLDCSNCHDYLFQRKAGATRMNMLGILSGEACGRCHGAVAFPLTDCKRCHSVPADGQVGQ